MRTVREKLDPLLPCGGLFFFFLIVVVFVILVVAFYVLPWLLIKMSLIFFFRWLVCDRKT